MCDVHRFFPTRPAYSFPEADELEVIIRGALEPVIAVAVVLLRQRRRGGNFNGEIMSGRRQEQRTSKCLGSIFARCRHTGTSTKKR